MLREQQRQIEWDCCATLTRFYDLFDRWDYPGMTALFMPNGLWHRAGKVLAGRSAILEEMSHRPTNQKVRHVLSNLLVDVVDERHAVLRGYITVYRKAGCDARDQEVAIEAPSLLVLVDAALERCGNHWLIARQVMQREFVFSGG